MSALATATDSRTDTLAPVLASGDPTPTTDASNFIHTPLHETWGRTCNPITGFPPQQQLVYTVGYYSRPDLSDLVVRGVHYVGVLLANIGHTCSGFLAPIAILNIGEHTTLAATPATPTVCRISDLNQTPPAKTTRQSCVKLIPFVTGATHQFVVGLINPADPSAAPLVPDSFSYELLIPVTTDLPGDAGGEPMQLEILDSSQQEQDPSPCQHLAPCPVATTVPIVASATTSTPVLAAQSPQRLLDTRPASQVGYVGGKPGARSVVEISVPANAGAVALSVTALDADTAGYVTVFPCGSDPPLASNLNVVPDAISANLAITKVGPGNKVCVYPSVGANLVADLDAVFPVGSSFAAQSPVRLLDTRPDSRIGFSGAKPGPGETVEIAMPAGADSVAFNLTAVDPTADGYVTAFACGTAPPLASNLNAARGATSANLVIAKVGADHKVCLYTQSGANLLADLAGVFPSGSGFNSQSPQRLLDTRPDSQIGYSGAKPSPNAVVEVAVPSSSEAVALNVTAVEATNDGYVTVYPCGTTPPLASNINAVTRSARANLVLTKVGANNKVCIFTQSGGHFVADLAGTVPKTG